METFCRNELTFQSQDAHSPEVTLNLSPLPHMGNAWVCLTKTIIDILFPLLKPLSAITFLIHSLMIPAYPDLHHTPQKDR
ncbi:MAG: hypothetical protein LUF85_12275 [Bacteroides sp.]|nr:hypothetical protein [Bacteroides sp.]